MVIWQLIWETNGRLCLWAEDLSTTQTDSVVATEHPFALPAASLREQLSQLELEADAESTLALQLPSADGLPLLPSQLKNSTSARLQTWVVPVLEFSPLTGISFITSLPGAAPENVRYGESLRYWLEVSKYLLELLSRGRFLPGISRDEGVFAAIWTAVPENENDQRRRDELISGMPPVCHLALSAPSGQPLEAAAVFDTFLQSGADALIRMFLRAHSLCPPGTPGFSARHTARLEWLAALTRKSRTLNGASVEFTALEHKLRRWSSRLEPRSKREALQLCFRLAAPELSADNEQNFDELRLRVDLLLRPHSGSKEQLTAAELWNGQLGFLTESAYGPDELEERLLRDLGRARHVFPALAKALSGRFPEAVELSTDEAYLFLRETSALLEKADFGVLLPDWWVERGQALGLHLHVEAPEADDETRTRSHRGTLGLNQILNYSWQVALGERVMSAEEFQTLVARQLPLVAVNGRWVELQPTRVKAALDFLGKARKEKHLRALDALRLGLGVEDPEVELPVTSFSAQGWIEKLIQGGKELVSALPQPESFIGELRPYQLEGLRWLSFLSGVNIGGCLADDMGLGKTIQFLALLLTERELTRGEAKLLPTLLVVPMSILHNWHQEAQRFSPKLKTFVHHGPQRLSGETFRRAALDADLIITTYNLAFRDEALLSSVPWQRITLDEAQNIKNPKTKQSRAIRRIMQQQLVEREAAGPVERLGLTGTPLENHLEELWSIFEFLNPGYLGSLKQFRSRFAVPIERYRDVDAASRLSRLVSPFILRRLKRDPQVISDLPEKIEIDVHTSLTAEQAALYQSVVDSMLPQVDQAQGMHRKGLVLATITKLKQICDHPALFLKDQRGSATRSGKLALLDELLEVVLDEGDKVLIFTQFAQMGHLLRAHLEERFDRPVLFLHGGLNQAERVAAVSSFQKPDGPAVFVLSLKAGGLGLNLTEANQVVHFDQWWNPAVQEQATDRAYRIGQKRNVQVRKLICRGTLEERIHAMLSEKRDLAERVVSSSRNTLTQLSTDELRELLHLSAPRDYVDE